MAAAADVRAGAARPVQVDDRPEGFPLRTTCVGLNCPGDHAPAWSPDGDAIAFVRARSLVVARPDGSRARVLVRGVSGFSWSPDGHTILFACAGWTRLGTVDARGAPGQRPRVITSAPADLGYMTADTFAGWSRDGKRVAFNRAAITGARSSWCCQLWVANADGSSPILLGPSTIFGQPVCCASWSPDGRLAFVDDGLWLADGDGSNRTLVAQGAGSGVWSGDSRLAFHIGSALWITSSDGTGTRLVHDELPGAMQWLPDGKRLLIVRVVDHAVLVDVVWVDDVPVRVETLFSASSEIEVAALSADGALLGVVGYGRIGVTVLDIPDRDSALRFLAAGASSQAEEFSRPTFSPDGRLLLYVSDRGCPTRFGLHSIRPDGRGGRQLTQRCRIDGTMRSETLRGTAKVDGILGRGGADRILAGPSPDLVRGGAGMDTIDGGRGDDRLYGDRGRDVIRAGRGWDAVVVRDRSADRVECGWGRDIVWADRRDDVDVDCEVVVRS